MEKKTPLYRRHTELSGKIIPFGGYLLPVSYESGIIAEHMAVRERCGLFDVSHMGEIVIEGPDAFLNVQRLLTNDFSGMNAGRIRYTLLCNDEGGILDDLLVYKQSDERYLLVVNAANREKDADWIKERVTGDARFYDVSDDTGQLALQGPLAKEVLSTLVSSGELPEKYYTFTEEVTVAGVPCLVSRTGYTGEDGFEIYMDAARAEEVFDALLLAGGPLGLIPCGLGSRDTLRLEASMPLYSHELGGDITPFEAGLSFAVKLDKEDFIGKTALLEKKEPKRRLAGLTLIDRGIVREGAAVYDGDLKVGVVTSGTHAPYLSRAIAMAFIDTGYNEAGRELKVEARGKKLAAAVTALPFYKREKK